MAEGNFKTRSFEYGGVGVIVVERINKEYAKRYAHLPAEGIVPLLKGFVFCASNSGFLTVNGERIIVRANNVRENM